MERKNIPFQYGIHRTPSMANDGELSECINIEAHNGELTPSVIPEITFTLQEGDKLLFVHTSGNYKNFIIQRGNLLCWFSDEDKETINEIGQISPISIHSVGNTLVVLSENEMEYILFKSGNYKRIGSKPPFCSISFGLKSQSPVGNGASLLLTQNAIEYNEDVLPNLQRQIDNFLSGELSSLDYNYEDLYNQTSSRPEESTNTEAITVVNHLTEQIHARLNPLKKSCREKGLFYDSFYIRYSYRMYDGSHYMQSAPIFMPINTEGPIIMSNGNAYNWKGDLLGMDIKVGLNACKLDYEIIGLYKDGASIDSSSLKDWEDIVKGIDIFVTPQITKFPESNKVYGVSSKTELSNSICYIGKYQEKAHESIKTYTNKKYSSMFGWNLVSNNQFVTFDLELKEDEDYIKEIKESSLFYKIYSFENIDSVIINIGVERTELPIKKNIVENLEQQEKLDDDYDSHNKIIPSFAHVYNGRLNIAGIRTKLFDGYPMESMVPYTYLEEGDNYTWTVRTCMEIDGKEVEVVSKSNIKLHEKPAFIYYPSTKGYKFKVYMYNDFKDESGIINLTAYSAEFKSEVHKLLNGAFYLSPSYGLDDVYELDIPAMNPVPVGDPYISYPNKIYTSEVNNPFFFPLSGRNSIGTGDIIAISSNTKAISPGQFGQYPMIVFSTDGVWAMQVAGDGLYQSIHPISKDICVNPNVLQTNGPILFATDNGLYSVISESVEHISKIMKGAPDIIDIPTVGNEYTFLMESAKSDMSFNTYIKEAIFAHDYINNRVVIYNPKMDFAYIYCMDCGMFAKMVIQKEGVPTRIESVVKAYPEVYMQSGADIYTFVHDRDDMATTPSKGIIVTRPMSFSDPLSMKVINIIKLIYRKRTEDTRCRYALFVSNDGNKWSVIPSLRGRSFKYFRFAVYTELADTDALVAMSVMFDYRRTNKLR